MASDVIAIQVRYHNILRRATDVDQETITLAAGASLRAALEHLADRHGPRLREMLFAPDGSAASHLVVFRNRQLVEHGQLHLPLAAGDELLLFPAVSGG